MANELNFDQDIQMLPSEVGENITAGLNTYPSLFEIGCMNHEGPSIDTYSLGYINKPEVFLYAKPRESHMSKEEIQASRIKNFACGLLSAVDRSKLTQEDSAKVDEAIPFLAEFEKEFPNIAASLVYGSNLNEIYELIQDKEVADRVLAFVQDRLIILAESGTTKVEWPMFRFYKDANGTKLNNTAPNTNEPFTINIGFREFEIQMINGQPIIEKITAAGDLTSKWNLLEIGSYISVHSKLEEGFILGRITTSEIVRNIKAIVTTSMMGEYSDYNLRFIHHAENNARRLLALNTHIHDDQSFEDGDFNSWIYRLGKSDIDALLSSPEFVSEFTDKFLERFHHEAVRTGIFILYPEIFGENPFDLNEFRNNLISMNSEDLSDSLLNILYSYYFFSNVKIPVINDSVKQKSKGQGQVAAVNKTNQPKSKEKKESLTLTNEELSLPKAIRQSGVVGISHLLDLADDGNKGTGQVRYGEDGLASLENELATIVYGTTDFANPVELISTAIAASRSAGEGIYFFDHLAHPVGSYLSRILIPSITSLYVITEEEIEALNELAEKTQTMMDIDLSMIMNDPRFEVTRNHFINLQNILGIEAKTFSELYIHMNKVLSSNLGINCSTAIEILDESNATLNGLYQYINEIKGSINIGIDRLREKIRSILQSKYPTKDYGPDLNNYMRSNIGNSDEWGSDSRLFVKSSLTGEIYRMDEESADEVRIADLYHQGYALGGNGWVILMQMLEHSFNNGIIIAHKATRQGANYALPLLGSSNAKIMVMPIVRCIPDSGTGKTGDGLDIGMYFIHPELVSVVTDHFKLGLKEPTTAGGVNQIIIKVSKASTVSRNLSNQGIRAWDGIKITSGVQPVEGGNIGKVSRKYIY